MRKLMLLLSATILTLSAGAQLAITRTGHNTIRIANTAEESRTVTIGNGNPFILGPRSSAQASFILDEYHLSHVPVTAVYDQDAYLFDSSLCADAALQAAQRTKRFHEMIVTLEAIFYKDMNFELALASLRMMAGLLGLPIDELDHFINQLTAIWLLNLGRDQKLIRMKALVESLNDRKNHILNQFGQCVDEARNNLGKISKETVLPIEQILLQLKSFVQISAFVGTGTRIRRFQGSEGRKTIGRLGFGEQPSWGLSAAFQFNAYDRYHRRKTGMRYYVPVSFTQTNALLKDNADSIFKAGTAISWKILSAGFGWSWEEYDNSGNIPIGAFYIDGGVFSAIQTNHEVSGGKILASRRTSSFKGFAPYLNIGYRHRVAGPLDLFGSWETSIFNASKDAKASLPNYFLFRFGASIRLANHHSFQY